METIGSNFVEALPFVCSGWYDAKDNVGVTLCMHCRPMVLNIEVIDRVPGKTEY